MQRTPMTCLLLLLVAVLALWHPVAAELAPSAFETQVLTSERVWVVKIYSAMCGSCQEFAPTWDKLKGSVDSVEFGELSIDQPEGMKIAEALGALNDGIPNVMVFAKAGQRRGETVYNGEGATTVQRLAKGVKRAMKGTKRCRAKRCRPEGACGLTTAPVHRRCGESGRRILPEAVDAQSEPCTRCSCCS